MCFRKKGKLRWSSEKILRAMTPRRIKMMILASWLWATFCATGPLIGWNEIIYKKGSSQCGPAIPNNFKALAHSLLITTSNYIVPLGVMIFCYSRIFREIHVHMKRIRETSNIDLENSVQQQKKVAMTLFLVLACFLLCWTPFVLYSNAAALIKDKKRIKPILNPLAYWCGYLNSACNPVIYAFRSPSFRKGYKEIMCGAPAPGLSAVHSLSFRSRSARGSLKSNSNTNTVKIPDSHVIRRQRTMLSQTSWKSLPLIPNLVRSLSTKQGQRNREPNSPEDSSGCGICGFWKPRPQSAHEVGQTDDACDHEDSNSRPLNNIHEDDENVRVEDNNIHPLNDMNKDDDCTGNNEGNYGNNCHDISEHVEETV